MGLKEYIGYQILGLPKPETENKFALVVQQQGDRIAELRAWLNDKERHIRKLEEENETLKKVLESSRPDPASDPIIDPTVSIEANRILSEVKRGRLLTPKDIGDLTHLSKSRTWGIIHELAEKGLIALNGTPKKPFITVPPSQKPA